MPVETPTEEPEAEGDDPGDLETNEDQEEQTNDGEQEEEGMWEETFKTHYDSKPYGEILSVNLIRLYEARDCP